MMIAENTKEFREYLESFGTGRKGCKGGSVYVDLTCPGCHRQFKRYQRDVDAKIFRAGYTTVYCSSSCSSRRFQEKKRADIKEFDNAATNTKEFLDYIGTFDHHGTNIRLKCPSCEKFFIRTTSYVEWYFTHRDLQSIYCSRKCASDIRFTQQEVSCEWCGKTRLKKVGQIAEDLHHFCSKQCSNNATAVKRACKSFIVCEVCGITVKRRQSYIDSSRLHFCGKRCLKKYAATHHLSETKPRSKIEAIIEEVLRAKFPSVNIQYNDRKTIKLELDIYLPDLKMAFEINGILHYKPIYGKAKLDRTKRNDKLKMGRCKKARIKLHVIDIRGLGHKQKRQVNELLDNIISKIERRLASMETKKGKKKPPKSKSR
jgi:hypothetical protein